MDVLKTITEIVNKLNEIDNYDSSLSQLLSECNEREQDLLHYIENNKINIVWCYKYVRELKNVREKRRNIKNDMERIMKFKEQKTKLASTIDNRQLMIAELNKREKQLNCPYKNRRYTEEELQKILKGGVINVFRIPWTIKEI